MNNIQVLKNFEFGKVADGEKSKEVKEIFNGSRRRLVSVELRNSEVLSKHKANEPITIFCLAGSGTFWAGKDLEDEQKLVAGTLITLEGGIEHEVVAEPSISLLVTKFKAE
jgi:quercetin dioxygenase-like cupin family protein